MPETSAVNLDEMKTVSLKGVEILAVGTWHGEKGGVQSYTKADLSELADAHAKVVALGAYAPVYLGHNDDPADPERPAVGMIERLYVRGSKLLADISDVPALVAKLIELKAYRGRSIEGYRTDVKRGFQVGNQKFRQVITGLALLGKNLPAVDGLADVAEMYVASSSGAGWYDASVLYPVALAAGDGFGAGDQQQAIDDVLSALDALGEQLVALVAGKRDAPIVRTRIRALKQDVRRIAGAGIVANEKGGDEMTDDKTEAAAVADKTAVANAAGDAGATAAPGAAPSTAPAVGDGGAMAFDNADQAVTYLAAITGKSPTDLAGVVAACLAALKAAEDAADGGADDASEGPGGAQVGMTKNDAGAAELPEVLSLTKRVAELLTWKAEQEGKAVASRAEGLVDAAIRAGKFVPAQRETLVSLAKLDAGKFGEMAKAQPVAVVLGERGSTGGAENGEGAVDRKTVEVLMRTGQFTEDEAQKLLRNSKLIETGQKPEKDKA